MVEMKFLKYFFISIILILLFSAAGAYLYLNDTLAKPAADSTIVLRIPYGTSVYKAVNLLQDKGALKPDWLFDLYIRYIAGKKENGLQAGYYKFDQGISNSELIESIFTGDNLFTAVITFPEGLKIEKYASLVAKEMNLDSAKFVGMCKDPSLLAKYGINQDNALGYMIPDTYTFFMDAKESDIFERLLSEFKKYWTNANIKKAKDLGLSIHEVHTLASIVEAESPVENERATVAGLYLNRLKNNWLLQADPTVQFAMGEKRRVLYKDLEIDNPYNTYKYAGLPPGPINNPGVSALNAVLNPEKHKWFYMVAVGDGSGKHNFAENMTGHSKNIRIFKKNIGR